MDDIRLNLNFRSHPKVKRLIRKLGEGAGLSLVTLWCYTAAHYPRGNFNGMDGDDIEDAAMWTGERGILLAGLLTGGLLDQTDDGFCVHDWKEHQRYVYFHPERVDRSRKANEARWHKKRGVNPKRTPTRNPTSNPTRNPPPPLPKKEEEGGHTGFLDKPVVPPSLKANCTTTDCQRLPIISVSGRWYCRECSKSIPEQGTQALK